MEVQKDKLIHNGRNQNLFKCLSRRESGIHSEVREL